MSIYLCGSAAVGHRSCWWCEGPVPRHVVDRRYCSHACAAAHATQIGDGPCTVCGGLPGSHPVPGDPHPYVAMTASPTEFATAMAAILEVSQ